MITANEARKQLEERNRNHALNNSDKINNLLEYISSIIKDSIENGGSQVSIQESNIFCKNSEELKDTFSDTVLLKKVIGILIGTYKYHVYESYLLDSIQYITVSW